MRVLFYDIESCTGRFGDICEFGYLITNENFEIEVEENIYIDPNNKFDNRIKREILSHDEEFYKSKSDFKDHYNKIKNLFENVDMVVGYSTTNDVEYLNYECYNYNLPFINYCFYDVQKLIVEYDNNGTHCSLEKALELFRINKNGILHNAVNDAHNTMLLFMTICANLKLNLKEVFSITKKIIDNTNNGIIESVAINHMLKDEKYRTVIEKCKTEPVKWDAYHILLDFTKKINVNKTANSKLKKIKFTFERSFINSHFYQMFNITKILADNGAKVVNKHERFDYYVCLDKTKVFDIMKINNNKKVIILNYDDLLAMLNISNEELLKMGIPSLNCVTKINPFENRVKGYKQRKSIEKEEMKKSITYMEELFKDYNWEDKVCCN